MQDNQPCGELVGFAGSQHEKLKMEAPDEQFNKAVVISLVWVNNLRAPTPQCDQPV